MNSGRFEIWHIGANEASQALLTGFLGATVESRVLMWSLASPALLERRIAKAPPEGTIVIFWGDPGADGSRKSYAAATSEARCVHVLAGGSSWLKGKSAQHSRGRVWVIDAIDLGFVPFSRPGEGSPDVHWLAKSAATTRAEGLLVSVLRHAAQVILNRISDRDAGAILDAIRQTSRMCVSSNQYQDIATDIQSLLSRPLVTSGAENWSLEALFPDIGVLLRSEILEAATTTWRREVLSCLDSLRLMISAHAIEADLQRYVRKAEVGWCARLASFASSLGPVKSLDHPPGTYRGLPTASEPDGRRYEEFSEIVDDATVVMSVVARWADEMPREQTAEKVQHHIRRVERDLRESKQRLSYDANLAAKFSYLRLWRRPSSEDTRNALAEILRAANVRGTLLVVRRFIGGDAWLDESTDAKVSGHRMVIAVQGDYPVWDEAGYPAHLLLQSIGNQLGAWVHSVVEHEQPDEAEWWVAFLGRRSAIQEPYSSASVARGYHVIIFAVAGKSPFAKPGDFRRVVEANAIHTRSHPQRHALHEAARALEPFAEFYVQSRDGSVGSEEASAILSLTNANVDVVDDLIRSVLGGRLTRHTTRYIIAIPVLWSIDVDSKGNMP